MAGRTYLFAGGGTGGHLFPGIAVAEQLLEREPQTRIVFAGSDRPIEREIFSRLSFEHRTLPSVSLDTLRRRPFWATRRIGQAYSSALRLMRELCPAAVIGCGGYTSAAALLAARRTGTPFLLLEQNAIPGRTTRWFARLGGTVCLTYERTASLLPRTARSQLTGNPVRRDIAQLSPGRNTPNGQTLLVLGGSQGAQQINDLMMELIRGSGSLLEGWRIMHQTGTRDLERVRALYAEYKIDARAAAFFPDLPDLYGQADLVISRAGGTTLSELACAGLPAILAPYPGAADDHQWYNAVLFQEAGAAVMLAASPTDPISFDRFAETLKSLGDDSRRRSAMAAAMSRLARPGAAKCVVDLLGRL
ncbi:MAG: undecaprenyldiphospho-muramoylpentapeptide beta-N-acetylglucosaminyltransferase [Planctomycetaceae bacterium]|nr:undecaprenyldiphospho-muramoylpentapeptide beta-N-acetylglucosaminyltransferase [Planctomycetaceae bacterium]